MVSQVHGTWGRAEQPPGITALDRGGEAQLTGVVRLGGQLRRWRRLRRQVRTHPAVRGQSGRRRLGQGGAGPRIAALNKGSDAEIDAVSCASAGNCSAGGLYDRQLWPHPGVRGQPGPRRLGQGRSHPRYPALGQAATVTVLSLSCGSAGNCSADGAYTDHSGNPHAFVVSQVHGTWGEAEQVPGLPALNKGDDAQISDLSCGSARNCAAAGYYTASSGHTQAFVVSRT